MRTIENGGTRTAAKGTCRTNGLLPAVYYIEEPVEEETTEECAFWLP